MALTHYLISALLGRFIKFNKVFLLQLLCFMQFCKLAIFETQIMKCLDQGLKVIQGNVMGLFSHNQHTNGI